MAIGAFVAMLAVATALWGATWYVTGEIAAGGLNPSYGPPGVDAEVVAVQHTRITLRGVGSDDFLRDGLWGVSWDGGFGRTGAVISSDPETDTAVREWESLGAVPPVGARVALESVPFKGDPLTAHGLAFESVSFETELGTAHTWLVPGDSETWAIFVHGKSSYREALIVAPITSSLGLPLLRLVYRNDPDGPPTQHGRFEYGATEWRDVEAGVRFALDSGAQDVVLFGTSMGGGIVMSFLYESSLASNVRAVVLDAPMLDLGRVFTDELVEGGVPGFATGLMLWAVERRYGIDIQAAEYISGADMLEAPMLLMHGSADQTIPVELSDRLAQARPDLIRYERLEGVTHARALQERPDVTAEAIRGFLEDVLGASGQAADAPSTRR